MMEVLKNDDSELRDCFELQLSEVEMLSSMYPNSSEFKVSVPSVLKDMNEFISGKTSDIPEQLDIMLYLDIPDIKDKLEVNVGFPRRYPKCKPDIYAGSTALSRVQQSELNSAVKEYMKELCEGELCVLSVITWLIENAAKYFSMKQPQKKSKPPRNKSEEDMFCRMWIYSHHIYNKIKRREIINSAQDLSLTGFSLPGKPGFVCIEGSQRDCQEFVQQLKQMSWKKISLVREETELLNGLSISNFRKFENFQEISFEVRRGPAREYHMDMGQFLKYLEMHDCAYVFHDLFGLEGHISNDK